MGVLTMYWTSNLLYLLGDGLRGSFHNQFLKVWRSELAINFEHCLIPTKSWTIVRPLAF